MKYSNPCFYIDPVTNNSGDEYIKDFSPQGPAPPPPPKKKKKKKMYIYQATLYTDPSIFFIFIVYYITY